ncbi:MAG TPA: OsmC family protein [Actinomycetota bacterium]|nr:OsmC family protein [Actinomycetota bacterium]
MEVTAYWEGGMRVRVPVRGFDLRADEPPAYGGADTGPMPTELFLASLASCFALAVRWVCVKQEGFEPTDLVVRVRGEYDGPRFDRLLIEVVSSDPRIDGTLDRAARYCYVSNTLRRPPRIELRRAERPVTHGPPPPPGR